MRYFLLTEGPLRERALGFQARSTAAREAHCKWLETNFKTTRCVMGSDGRPSIIAVRDCPGPGWKKHKHGWMVSLSTKSADAEALRAEVAALPADPSSDRRNTEAADLIGWDVGTQTHLAWADDKVILCVSHKDAFGMGSRERLRRLVELPIPEGCRELNQAEVDLIFAEHNAKPEAA